MAFNYVGSINGAQRNLTDPIVITSAHVVAVNDSVEVYSAGTAGNPTAAQPFKGIVAVICDANGQPIVKGTSTAGSANTPDTQSATGSGTTYYCKIDTSRSSLYSAEVSGTVGTTNSSGTVGARVDVDSATNNYGRVLETTATRNIGTPASFYIHKTDPNNSNRLIVSCALLEEDSVYE